MKTGDVHIRFGIKTKSIRLLFITPTQRPNKEIIIDKLLKEDDGSFSGWLNEKQKLEILKNLAEGLQ